MMPHHHHASSARGSASPLRKDRVGDPLLWDEIAPVYDSGQVLDNFASDMDGVLRARLEEVCARCRPAAAAVCQRSSAGLASHAEQVTAVDFGCGTGNWLGVLSQCCDSVIGIDFSLELLRRAAQRVESHQYPNVQLLQRNLSERWPLVLGASAPAAERGMWPRCDVAICANVLLSPDPSVRAAIMVNVHRALKPKGTLLLLVPAAESVALTKKTQAAWLRRCKERGLIAEALPESELDENEESGGGLGRTVFARDGVLTSEHPLDPILPSALAHHTLPPICTVGISMRKYDRFRCFGVLMSCMAAAVCRALHATKPDQHSRSSGASRRGHRAGELLVAD